MKTNMRRENDYSIAIITVTYCAEKFILDFLESLMPVLNEYMNFHLFLVDNNSTDGTASIISRFIDIGNLDKRVHFKPQSHNSGFGTGCNVGAQAARSVSPKYLWFLNPDTKVDIESVNNLLVTMESKKDADFVGSKLSNSSGDVRPGAFRFPGILNTFSSNLKLKLFDKVFPNASTAYADSDLDGPVDWLTGASFLVKARVFEELGGFDQKYFLYFEEVDLFYRAQNFGYVSYCSKESVVFHISGASTGVNNSTVSQKKRLPSYWYMSRRHFYMKNYGRVYFIVTDVVLIFSLSIRNLLSFMASCPGIKRESHMSEVFRHSGFFQKNP